MIWHITILLTISIAACIDWDVQNEMDIYVTAKDPIYSWTEVESFDPHPDFDNVSVHTLNVTTHTWMDEAFSDRSVWFHYMQVFIPKNVRHPDAAAIYIDGGKQSDRPPNPAGTFATFLAMLADEMGMTTGYLKMVPNQPIIFKDDPELKPRSEDDAIAHTWRKYFDDQSDPEVILQFPMTKGAYWSVTAMIERAHEVNPAINITRYFPSGGSKRGWITWLLGAVDRRVAGMAPIVLSCLNLRENFHHYFRALNGWSFVLNDYWQHNITGDMDSVGAMELERLVDPLSYNERMTMPKVVVSAVGDEFFMPDDHHYFFNDLLEPKYVFMLPNAEHSIAPWYGKVYRCLRGLIAGTLARPNFVLPRLTWTRNETQNSGSITLWTDRPVNNITAWSGENNHNTRRDFRYVVLPDHWDDPVINIILWDPSPVEQISETQFYVEFDKTYPVNGTWFGFFIEVEFDGPDGMPMSFTTDVNIIPDIFLYPRCQGFEQCQGTLR